MKIIWRDGWATFLGPGGHTTQAMTRSYARAIAEALAIEYEEKD